MKKSIIKVLSFALVAVMMCAVLVSCGGPNKDPKKAAEALEEAGYSVQLVDENMPEGYEATIIATKIDLENEKVDFISIAYYSDTEVLNADWEEAQDSVKDMAEEMGLEESEIVVKKSGKMIYIGTKDAVKAAK